MSKNPELDKVVTRLGDLPSMPEIVSEVLSKTEDASIALGEVSDTIQRDPALTAKILKVSNSPYYGMRQVVGTLKLALVILGVREIRNIVLGVSVLDALRDESTDRLLKQQGFWDHSVGVAAMAKKIGTHLKLGMQGEDFISGLLHDIGKMVLWRQFKEEYEAIYKASGGSSEALCKMEIKTYGFDHADAAAALADRWNLPETLGDALGYHHARGDRSIADLKDPKLAAIVRIANTATRNDWTLEDVSGNEACHDDEAWAFLSDSDEAKNPAWRAELLTTFAKEIEEMPTPSF